jgi:hypothetical protein
MSKDGFEKDLRGANPVSKRDLAALDLAAGEAELGRAIVVESAASEETGAPETTSRRPRSAWVLVTAAAAAAAAVLVLLLAPGGASRSPAYGAELVRFAESTPLLLLEGPGWRVESVWEAAHGPYSPDPGLSAGSMEFVTGKPIPYESLQMICVRQVMSKNGKFPICKDQRAEGMLPPGVRQRKVELFWRHEALERALATARGMSHPHGQNWIRLPVLETTADVDTKAEFFVNQGGPGNRQMTALWSEGGYLLELKAAVPDLAAFEERLGWLTRVDSQTWLDAMPAKVVKAADHDAVVREMLKGIPVPEGFSPSQVPDEGLTTDRYQVGASVAGVVSCLWFRQWGEARRSGDRQSELEAERAMATSKRWPILREMAKDGAYSEVVWELARDMPSGHWEWAGKRHRLLPRAEGLGCARWGMPVLPWKQRRQDQRGGPTATASGS